MYVVCRVYIKLKSISGKLHSTQNLNTIAIGRVCKLYSISMGWNKFGVTETYGSPALNQEQQINE